MADSELETTKHLGGKHDQKRHGQRFGMPGLRDVARKHGLTVRTLRDGKIGIYGKDGRTNMRADGITDAKKLIRSSARHDRDSRTRNMRRVRDQMQKKVDELSAIERRYAQYEQQLRSAKDPAARSAIARRFQADQKRQAMIKLEMRSLQAEARLYTKKEASSPASLSVFKDAAGKFRWALFSSNAYRDRDREIVSKAALEADVTRDTDDGTYGELRWWHDKDLVLGTCDGRALSASGRTLIETGTFINDAIGLAVQKAARYLQVSIGFYHPQNEPDPAGVYLTIKQFERSLLPRGRAANPFTQVFVKGDPDMATKEEKLAALRKLIGEDHVDALLAAAQHVEKDLDDAGMVFKSADDELPAAEELPAVEEPAAEEPAAEAPVIDGEAAPEVEKAAKPAPDEEADEGEEEGEDVPVIGNMPLEDFQKLIASAVAEAVADAMKPVSKMLHAHDPAAEADARQKEATERAVITEAVNSMLAAQTAHAQQLSAAQTALKEAVQRLADLEGSTPPAAKGYIASAGDDNVIDEARAKELGAPTNQPAGDFFGWMLNPNA